MIASELVPGPNGEMITRGELLLRSWIKSKNPILQRSFVEYWIGKPPEKLEVNKLEPGTRLVLHYGNELPAALEAEKALRLRLKAPSATGDGNSKLP
jgi:hypothetical protein